MGYRFVISPAPKTWSKKAFDAVILRSWWAFLFIAFSYLLYSQGMHKKREMYQELLFRLKSLEAEKQKVLEDQEDLLLQINSQNDPAWIEMVLMKGIGVVPEGQTKVYFEKDN
jgi:hypothetical protein